MRPEIVAELERLHAGLQLRRLKPVWAKCEIVLGLAAVGTGLFIGMGLAVRLNPPPDLVEWLAPLALFTLGGYLALAGHRSHLYQSSNALVAYLAGQLRSTEPKSIETHP